MNKYNKTTLSIYNYKYYFIYFIIKSFNYHHLELNSICLSKSKYFFSFNNNNNLI